MGVNLFDLPPDAQRQAIKQMEQQAAEKRAREGAAGDGGTPKAASPTGIKKPSKMHNEPTVRQGIKFPSIKEADRYDELLLMLAAGQIRDLRLQVDFTLQESYMTTKGVRVRAIRYRADFTYEERVEAWKVQKSLVFDMNTITREDGWRYVVEDVKGHRTQMYRNKKKMMHDKFGITIREV
jgi:hypothetical protein